MNKIKKIDEFNNILEYFYYLKDSLDDLKSKYQEEPTISDNKYTYTIIYNIY